MKIDDRQNVLISFHYWKKMSVVKEITPLWPKKMPRVVLDSGAWSSFTQGVPIAIDAYIRWCHDSIPVTWWYSNLDDMTSWKITLQNQVIMEKAGLKPVPVFHTGEPWKVLEDYCERYPFVAVGKIVPYSTRPAVIVPWIRRVFEIAAKRGTNIHGFGVSNCNLIKMFPFFSVDSSSWTSGHRFGTVKLWDRLTATMKTAWARTPADFNTNRALFMEHRYEELPFYSKDIRRGDGRETMAAISAVAYCKMQDYIRERGNKRLALCLASANKMDLAASARAMGVLYA
jgi:hypothetical protein